MLATRMILEGIGEKIISQLRNDIKNKSLVPGYPPPDASGDLVNSLWYEATDTNLKVYALPYIGALEFGRKPGKRPPRAVIRKWIDEKGIIPKLKANGKPLNKDVEKAKDSLAFLIQRKIGEKGTLIYQQGGSDLLSSIINDNFIQSVKDELIFNTVEAIRSEILKGVAA